jgi:hypothetical protein
MKTIEKIKRQIKKYQEEVSAIEKKAEGEKMHGFMELSSIRSKIDLLRWVLR